MTLYIPSTRAAINIESIAGILTELDVQKRLPRMTRKRHQKSSHRVLWTSCQQLYMLSLSCGQEPTNSLGDQSRKLVFWSDLTKRRDNLTSACVAYNLNSELIQAAWWRIWNKMSLFSRTERTCRCVHPSMVVQLFLEGAWAMVTIPSTMWLLCPSWREHGWWSQRYHLMWRCLLGTRPLYFTTLQRNSSR